MASLTHLEEVLDALREAILTDPTVGAQAGVKDVEIAEGLIIDRFPSISIVYGDVTYLDDETAEGLAAGTVDDADLAATTISIVLTDRPSAKWREARTNMLRWGKRLRDFLLKVVLKDGDLVLLWTQRVTGIDHQSVDVSEKDWVNTVAVDWEITYWESRNPPLVVAPITTVRMEVDDLEVRTVPDEYWESDYDPATP